MQLKSIFLGLILLISSTKCSSQIPSVSYELVIKKFKTEKVNGETNWLIECVLSNKTTKTLNYLSMSCSLTDFYCVDNLELQIDPLMCERNIPVILSLPPYAKRSTVIRLYKKKGVNKMLSDKLKVGLNVIKTSTVQDFEKKIKTKNIIWSNTIPL